MSSPVLPLVFLYRERAVFHLVDPAAVASELVDGLGLYFEPDHPLPRCLCWQSPDGPRILDPARAIGEQVPPEAEIEIRLL